MVIRQKYLPKWLYKALRKYVFNKNGQRAKLVFRVKVNFGKAVCQ